MLTSFSEFSNSTSPKSRTTRKRKVTRKTNEAVTKVNDEFKVKTVHTVPISMVKEYIDKVKRDVGKNPLEFWSASDIAEELIKYTLQQYMKIDNLPSKVIFGDTRTRAEQQQAAETAEVDVKPAEATKDKQDFTRDSVEQDIAVEEEELFGMAENLTDSDITYIK